MPKHAHPRSPEARVRRAEKRRLLRLARLGNPTLPEVDALAPSQQADAAFVAAAGRARLNRRLLSTTALMYQRAVEALLKTSGNNKPRGAPFDFG